MNIVFLDIDGVLNSTRWAAFTDPATGKPRGYGGPWKKDYRLDPECVARLQRLCTETEAHIVVSSTWRIGGSLMFFREMFAHYGWADALVLDKTPQSRNGFRGDEVRGWLSIYEGVGVDRFVILDDNSDFHDDQRPFFVQTDYAVGLTDADAQHAISILRGEA